MTFSKFLVIQPIHDMQLDWKRIEGILTIAIGDGGNELGMGKVHEEIITTIPEGDLIGKLDSTSSWRLQAVLQAAGAFCQMTYLRVL